MSHQKHIFKLVTELRDLEQFLENDLVPTRKVPETHARCQLLKKQIEEAHKKSSQADEDSDEEPSIQVRASNKSAAPIEDTLFGDAFEGDLEVGTESGMGTSFTSSTESSMTESDEPESSTESDDDDDDSRELNFGKRFRFSMGDDGDDE